MAIRRLVTAGLLAALAAAGITIAVMPEGGTGPVTSHSQIVAQGVPISSGGPTIGPIG